MNLLRLFASMKIAPPLADREELRRILFALLLLGALLAGQGFYASQLNLLFYQHFGPFYDSAAYTNQLAEVMWTTKIYGYRAALQAAYPNSTVLLPWLEAIALSYFLPPTRTLGIWMQELLMFLLAGSVFYYLHSFRKAGFVLSFCLTLPLISFQQVYFFNGGIADFRMDLSLYALLGVTVTWFLIACESKAFWPWAATALSALLCVLNRATSPAYLGFALGPVFLARWFWATAEDRRRLLRHALTAGVPAAALAGVYLWSKWSFLHYYYFVWGPDPTARLPFRQGIKHFEFAMTNAGRYTLYACLAMGAAVLAARLRESFRTRAFAAERLTPDLRLAWLAAAPPLLLALEGAGYNPFVAMPGVFAGLLFLMLPFKGDLSNLEGSFPVKFACAVLVTASLFNAALGVTWHRDPPGPNSNIQALKRGVELMAEDAERRGLKTVQYATAHIAWCEAILLRNVLYYDFRGIGKDGGIFGPRGLIFRTDYHNRFSASAEINWTQELPGTSDEEKLRFLADLASREIDYFFLPDEPTLTNLETHFRHNFINNKVRFLRQKMIESGDWAPVGPPLEINQYETVQLYANRRRGTAPQP